MAAGTLPLGSRFAWAQSYPSGPLRAAALSLAPGMVLPEPNLACPTGDREHIEE